MKRRSSKENGVVGISCKKKEGSEACSCLLLFAFQTRSRLKNTRKESHYFLHWMKSAFFCLFHWIFINVLIVSQKFCIVLEAFVSFVECGIFQWNRRIFSKLVEYPWPKLKKKSTTNKQTKTKNIKKRGNDIFFSIACNLRLFAHSSSSPKRKY